MKTYEMGTGRVVFKTTKLKTEDGKLLITTQPVFKGAPEKVAQSLIKMHNVSGALAIIDKLPLMDDFWKRARKYVENRLVGTAKT